MGPRGTPEALEGQCWGPEPTASPLPSSLELALLPGSAPPPKRPDTGVTSATSWCSVPLDPLRVLVTLSLLGSEPGSACPSLAPGYAQCSGWSSPGVGRGLASPVHMGPVSCSAAATNVASCLPFPTPPSCLYLPGDMTLQPPESSAGEQPSPSDPDPDFMPGWSPGASFTLCCPPYSCTHGGRASGPDLLPTGAEASGGTYSIWHILDSPPEWALGLDMGHFKAYRVV